MILSTALDSKLVCMLTHCEMIESREPKVHVVKQNENTHVSYINGAMDCYVTVVVQNLRNTRHRLCC